MFSLRKARVVRVTGSNSSFVAAAVVRVNHHHDHHHYHHHTIIITTVTTATTIMKYWTPFPINYKAAPSQSESDELSERGLPSRQPRQLDTATATALSGHGGLTLHHDQVHILPVPRCLTDDASTPAGRRFVGRPS
jgi:hypothetical protein